MVLGWIWDDLGRPGRPKTVPVPGWGREAKARGGGFEVGITECFESASDNGFEKAAFQKGFGEILDGGV